MKARYIFHGIILFIVALTSCRSVDEIDKRKYTDGFYHDISIGKNKADKSDPVVIENERSVDSIAERISNMELSETTERIISFSQETLWQANFNEIRTEVQPVRTEKKKSELQQRVLRDTPLLIESLPASDKSVIGRQAMAPMKTERAFVAGEGSESTRLKLFIIFTAPISMLFSLICVTIAHRQLVSGKIDRKFKRCMKLWAIGLLINLAIAAFVLIQYPI